MGLNTFWRRRFLLLAILLLATGLRFYRLDAQSFWNDEGNSARLSERSIPLIIEGTASDIHPPLYYLVLRGWRELVGETEFGLRSFSAFAGILTVAVTFALGKEFWTRINADDTDKKENLRSSALTRVPLLAALLTAVSPPLIYYSQETRMYALLAFWAVLATWLLLRWQACVMRHTSCVRWAVVYVMVVAAGLYTHYFFPAVILFHNLIVLIWLIQNGRSSPAPLLPRPSTRLLTRWTLMMLATFLLYLPWLPIFIRQTGGRAGVRPSLSAFLLDSARWLSFGATIDVETAVIPLMAVVVLVFVGALIHWRWMWTAVLGLSIPVLFMFAAGTAQPEFFKFMLTAVPFFSLLAVAGSLELKINDSRLKSVQPLIFILLIIIVLVGNGRSLINLYYNPTYARVDYRGMADRIAAENYPNAGIILDAPNQWEVFTYYHRDGAPVYPLPLGRPDPVSLDAELTTIAAQHGRLYAIFWGEAQRDPERLVERWLDEHAFKATDEWVGDVRFVTYAVPEKPATDMETAVAIPFGDVITLNGYTLADSILTPGDILQITLFWETAAPLSERYKVFLHLVNENGELVAQRDSEPGGGLNLTANWQPGDLVLDNHGILIPADAPNGDYRLLLGLYPLSAPNARLPIQTEAGVIDAYPLAAITVE